MNARVCRAVLGGGFLKARARHEQAKDGYPGLCPRVHCRILSSGRLGSRQSHETLNRIVGIEIYIMFRFTS